jgi:hypothetical protein
MKKTTVQIVGFEGYDSDLGGFTLRVRINGTEHEIINQCFPYEDGYAESLVDVYGSRADCLCFVDGRDWLPEDFVSDCGGDEEFAEKVLHSLVDEVVNAYGIYEEERTETSGKDKEYEQKAANGWFVDVECGD